MALLGRLLICFGKDLEESTNQKVTYGFPKQDKANRSPRS